MLQDTASTSPPAKKAKTKYPKIFQCTGYGDCKMTFTRSEHLARHIRKHTGERPFRCHCNRYFSRLDNLRQHIQTVHANEHHILHAAPPSPLPHSNKIANTTVRHSLSASALNVEKQYPYPAQGHNSNSGTPPATTILTSHPNSNQHIIIEQQQQLPPPSPSSLNFQPTTFRSRHRPHPLHLAVEDGASPSVSPMNSATTPVSPDHSRLNTPQAPYFTPTFLRPQGSVTPTAQSSFGFGMGQAYPPTQGQQPNTPIGAQAPTHFSSPSYDASYRSLPSASSSHNTTPLSTTSKGSWLSSVLNDAPAAPDERPRTWGPSSGNRNSLNRYSGAADEPGDRSSLPGLVRISEDAQISDDESNKLPSFSSLLKTESPSSSARNQSYLKNMVLPQPDGYAGPGYALPVADTRPPGLGGAESSSISRKPLALSKPLPPLPVEANTSFLRGSPGEPYNKGGPGYAHAQPPNGSGVPPPAGSAPVDARGAGGMEVLLQAAGV